MRGVLDELGVADFPLVRFGIESRYVTNIPRQYPPPMLTIDDIEMDVAGVHEVRSPTIAHGGHFLPLFHLS
jgi:hypothetical protein